MSSDAKALTCDTCDAATEEIPAAMQHVSVNPGHEMTATIDDEGTTLTISMTDDEDDDDYDDNPADDDWAMQ